MKKCLLLCTPIILCVIGLVYLLGDRYRPGMSDAQMVPQLRPYNRSVVEILSRPELYDGKMVRCVGYVSMMSPFTGLLFGSSESRSNGDIGSAVWVGFRADSDVRVRPEINGALQVTGRFRNDPDLAGRGFRGYLIITDFETIEASRDN